MNIEITELGIVEKNEQNSNFILQKVQENLQTHRIMNKGNINIIKNERKDIITDPIDT